MKKYAFRALQFCAIITITMLVTSCSKKSGCYFSATTPVKMNRTHIHAVSGIDQPGSFHIQHEITPCAMICE